jgi:transcription elongation GreA/GreB family factor
MSELKKELFRQCNDYVQKRMETVRQSLAESQQASNDETKSSAGDKYETSREMMQQETNRNIAHLNELNKLMVALNTIGTQGKSTSVENGSVVITNKARFYIAISAGILTVHSDNYYAISPASPIGHKLLGKSAGDELNVNGTVYKIEGVK